jgi:hypothetical protein
MLRTLNDLEDYSIQATDGKIGQVTDFYFDDQRWVVRYLVVNTGGWLSERLVLISPISIGKPDWAKLVLPVSITREQVRNSPDVSTDQPVSRQDEIRHARHFGYPNYWEGNGFWGAYSYPAMMLGGFVPPLDEQQNPTDRWAPSLEKAVTALDSRPNGDPHLRSGKALTRYRIEASDGTLGHVQGFLVEEDTWAVRYLIVATSDWWLGHQVLIAPQWISEVSWPYHSISLNLTRQAIKDAPPYDSLLPLQRTQELGLHQHYGRIGYWSDRGGGGTADGGVSTNTSLPLKASVSSAN